LSWLRTRSGGWLADLSAVRQAWATVTTHHRGRAAAATPRCTAPSTRTPKVAIKVLHPELTVSFAADRFLREIRGPPKLDHPHIAPAADSRRNNYLLWFVMPFVRERRSAQWGAARRTLPIRAVRVATEVLDALATPTTHGLAHRDIKPDNIVLSAEGGGAILVDFGIARAIAARAKTG